MKLYVINAIVLAIIGILVTVKGINSENEAGKIKRDDNYKYLPEVWDDVYGDGHRGMQGDDPNGGRGQPTFFPPDFTFRPPNARGSYTYRYSYRQVRSSRHSQQPNTRYTYTVRQTKPVVSSQHRYTYRSSSSNYRSRSRNVGGGRR